MGKNVYSGLLERIKNGKFCVKWSAVSEFWELIDNDTNRPYFISWPLTIKIAKPVESPFVINVQCLKGQVGI
jgi:hypothetical protein